MYLPKRLTTSRQVPPTYLGVKQSIRGVAYEVLIDRFGAFFAGGFEIRSMPSETTALLRSIRQWLLAATFLLGIILATVAHAGYVISGYTDEGIFGAATVIGVTIAVSAVASLLLKTPSQN